MPHYEQHWQLFVVPMTAREHDTVGFLSTASPAQRRFAQHSYTAFVYAAQCCVYAKTLEDGTAHNAEGLFRDILTRVATTREVMQRVLGKSGFANEVTGQSTTHTPSIGEARKPLDRLYEQIVHYRGADLHGPMIRALPTARGLFVPKLGLSRDRYDQYADWAIELSASDLRDDFASMSSAADDLATRLCSSLDDIWDAFCQEVDPAPFAAPPGGLPPNTRLLETYGILVTKCDSSSGQF